MGRQTESLLIIDSETLKLSECGQEMSKSEYILQKVERNKNMTEFLTN